ncbi:MAG: TonB-dependent receptor [Wenzhouxiangellaceae bacterium]|nr:TonB-dependent receptor [Wenzhouxiangellaceae bacterium]
MRRDTLATRIGLLAGLALILFGLAFSVLAEAQPTGDQVPPARLQVYVFEGGRPVDDLIVRFGELTGRTEGGGHWRAELPPARDRLLLFDNTQALTALPLELRAGELIQVIITLFGDERRAMVSVESSLGVDRVEYGQPAETIAPAEAGSGLLRGRVVSTEDGRPIAGARVFVSGTPVDVRTDDDGRFETEVPAGDYSVSVLHAEFATRTIDGVAIAADETTERNFELPPAGLELAEFVVVEPFIQGSISAVLDERRETASVAEVLGAEQMSRAGDGDAASALRRVTGLNLVGGGFVFIRGLGERYSSTLLNGATVPSPDPTRKVVPLDLFPTGVIESILVQKGYTAKMPGDFGGGAIEIRTTSIPEESFFKLGISTTVREGTTFKDGRTYTGGDTDFAGFDDGIRQLPRPVAEAAGDDIIRPANPFTNPDGLTPEQIETLGESFTGIWDQRFKTVMPDRSVSVEGGMRFEPGEDWELGFAGSVLWGDSWQSRTETRQTFTIGQGELQLRNDLELDRTRRETNLSGLLTGGVTFRDNHHFEVSSMILRLTEDDASQLEGFDEDQGGIIRIFELEFEEQELISNQVKTEHRLPFLLDIGVRADYAESRARRLSPDNRIARFDPDPNSPSGFVFSRRADNNFRNFSDLRDRIIDFGFDGDLPFLFGFAEGRLEGGWRRLERDRDSSIRRFKFEGISRIPLATRRLEEIEAIINADTIGPRGLELREVTRATDNSTAVLDIDAWFSNLDVTLFDTLRLSGGVRIEDWTQRAETFELFTPEQTPIVAELGERDLLPSVAATWFVSPRQQLRASYAETLVRPDLRELSPAPFTDPVLDEEVRGNPDLVPTSIQHYDLRYDFSPTPSEIFSIGGFYKLIDKPIELIQQPGAARQIGLVNAEEAENFGFEVEWRKQMGFLGRWLPGESEGWLERFTVSGNYSWIDSEITIAPEDSGIVTSRSRALQGQAEYVANFQIAYDHPDESLEVTLLYNITGKRISQVGVLGAPDQFVQPAPVLDFNLRYQARDNLTLKLKAGNLLDSAFEILQGGETTQRYRRGRTFGLGVDLKF